jgi:hypothetical protein
MVTKRTPIARGERPKLTDAAIEAYREMKILATRCTCPPRQDPNSPTWKYHPPCAACEEYDRLEMQIHRELKCRPWEIPCFRSDPPDDDEPGAMWERLAYARYVALEKAITRRPA